MSAAVPAAVPAADPDTVAVPDAGCAVDCGGSLPGCRVGGMALQLNFPFELTATVDPATPASRDSAGAPSSSQRRTIGVVTRR